MKACYAYLWEFIFEDNRTLESIFKEKGLFETFENKNPLKITSYTVYTYSTTLIEQSPICNLQLKKS